MNSWKKWVALMLALLVIPLTACQTTTQEGSIYLIDYDEEDYDITAGSEDNTIMLLGDDITFNSDAVTWDGSLLTITKEGSYTLVGELDDGQIVVNTDSDSEVRLILAGATIHYASGPAILVENAKKVIISLQEGTENTVSDSADYVLTQEQTAEDEPYGAIFSYDDLTINGSGALLVYGNYKNGMVSKDDLLITGGNLTVDALEDGIKGKDSVGIESAKLVIYCGDDGIHAETSLYIAGGNIQIQESYEGLEAAVITIDGGEIDINASDDGINAAQGTDSTSNTGLFGNMGMETNEDNILTINGGTITVNSDGDGLDSNGYIYQNGGTVYVDGPTNSGNGALDYGIEYVMNGGMLVAVGSSGMAEAISESSEVNCIFSGVSSGRAGSEIHLLTEDGETVLTYSPQKEYSSVVIAGSIIEDGETYVLMVDDAQVGEVTISATINTIGSVNANGMQGGMQGGMNEWGNQPGGRNQRR